MRAQLDIYESERVLEAVKNRLRGSSLSQRNKQLILSFDRVCVLEKLSLVRRAKLMTLLAILGKRYLRKDFDQATADDLKRAYVAVHGRRDLSVWSKHDYGVVIRKFWKWLAYGDEYFMKPQTQVPETVSWLTVYIKKKDRPMVTARDILTEDEVARLIDAAQHPRDKCFVSMLYETGTRIGEIGGLRVGDVTKESYGYVLDVRGKTGTRTPIVVVAAPHVTNWMNVHPRREDPKAPLWIAADGRTMRYASLRALLMRLSEKAGVTKRVHPHLFRHSRVTHVLVRGILTAAQAEVYFGWIPGTKAIEQYSHLVSKNANDAILQSLGLVEREDPKIDVKKCHMCSELNDKSARFCARCGNPLDVKTAVEILERRRRADDLMDLASKHPELIEALEKIFGPKKAA